MLPLIRSVIDVQFATTNYHQAATANTSEKSHLKKELVSEIKLIEIINAAFQSNALTSTYSIQGIKLRSEPDILGCNWHISTLTDTFNDAAMWILIESKRAFHLEELA